jgi:tetratricopeptide (TPR) repeat protein
MQPGDVLGERFELEARAGSGGMGEVFRARDRTSGEAVAVKVLLSVRSPDQARFAREATMLAELVHSGIVRYIEHDLSPSGPPYLVMEWLEGEDLSARVRRGALTVEETVTLGVQVTQALSVAHARGVVHRDLKPSNLFLVGREVRQVKVLDFGIARLGDATRMTETGTVVGTPGYMAPEQVQSGGEIDARADVFALGCVLFECLTGAPLFTGEHFMAVLAKILFEEVPRLYSRRPDAPGALDALIARMLAKDRDGRPRDAMAVASALAALGEEAPPSSEAMPPSLGGLDTALTGSERRVLSVVLLGGYAEPADDAALMFDDATPSMSEGALRQAVEAHGGDLGLLADGSVIVMFADPSAIATDQAAQAARVALALHTLAPERPIALATGRAEVAGKLPVGEVIERAARMVVNLETSPEGALAAGAARPVAIDAVTGGLLDPHFEVVEGAQGLELHGEQGPAEGARTLLGKPTSCVGRDWELSALEALWTECMEESLSRAVLVTAPAGMGKSRLAYEFVCRVRQRGQEVAIWSGRVDSLQAGSAFGLLGQALRGALGIQDGAPLAARRQKLGARVAEHVAESDRQWVTEFLGELVGTPFPDEQSVPLRAARQDAQLMGDQMCSAWLEFLHAETATHPVLLLLEDLHWGDLPTVRFIDTALREMSGQPFLVLALARPEVHESFPKLWMERRIQEVRLKELSRKASAWLVREVLGDSVGAETVDRIVTQAEGHAFYLEELIRAVAEGKGTALPETVLAMVEARLAALPGEARRVLRAASVFGEVLWSGGVAQLLGGTLPRRANRTEGWLSFLVEREVLVRRLESPFPGEQEFAFRHALLREGAYAMLTEEDRTLGHRLAGEWLSQREEGDAIVLAEHFERGKDPARAASSYLRAAEQAHRGEDEDAVIARARRGLMCNPLDELRASLLGLLCEAYVWRNEMSTVAPYAEEVIRLAEPGSAPWARAVQAKIIIAASAGMAGEFMATVDILRSADPRPGAVAAVALTLAIAVYYLDLQMQFELATIVLERLHAIVESTGEREPIAWAWMSMNHAHREAWAHDDPWSGLCWSEVARSSFEQTNQKRHVPFAQLFLGMNLWFLGSHARAERELRSAINSERSFGTVSGALFLVQVLAESGALEDAYLLADRMLETGKARQDPMDEGRGRWALAEVLHRRGDLDAAEREARAACELLATVPLDQFSATVTLAAVLLAQGRAREALATAEEAMARSASMPTCGMFRGALLRLVRAEALLATGDHDGARVAIVTARACLLTNADKIGDPAYRKSFLENVPENARTLALARAWLGEGEDAPAV